MSHTEENGWRAGCGESCTPGSAGGSPKSPSRRRVFDFNPDETRGEPTLHLEKDLDLNQFLIEHPSSTFFVRVAGDSMIEAGIMPNDYLVVDRSRHVRQNDIVIAVVDSELTVKRFFRAGPVIELRPENKAYPTIKIQGDTNLLIWGVVIGVFRKH